MSTLTTGPRTVTGATYTEVATDYARFISESATDQEFAYKPVLKALSPLTDKRVLDYGCGPGTFSRQMAEEGAHVVGVDIAPDALALAKAEQPKAGPPMEFHSIESADLEKFGKRRFDAATVNFVFCTIGDRSEIVRILKSIHGSLKPGSKVVITDQDWEQSNGREFINTALTRAPNLSVGKAVLTIAKGANGTADLPLQDHYWPASEYKAMLEEAGFKLVATETPIASDESHPWLDERTHPPVLMITGQVPLDPKAMSDVSSFEPAAASRKAAFPVLS